ncbi:MAG: hypothetical protein LBE11_00130 [Prevotellaceae bacterium]|jgi:hypothetical protein|nr:hypothetical protein [Prevotellaceae bacterium]
MCEICNSINPSNCPICGHIEEQEVYLIDCPDCKGDSKHCCTCYGAGVTFNVDIDDLPDSAKVECPVCGLTVEAHEISFNKCRECNRIEDAAEEARFQRSMKKIDAHIENIRKINSLLYAQQ